MLNEMGKAGVMPTVDTFNTLMDACIRRVDPPAVLRLFRQMVQSGALFACVWRLFITSPSCICFCTSGQNAVMSALDCYTDEIWM